MNWFLNKMPNTVLRQCLSEPEIYGVLVYKLKRVMGKTDFADQFGKVKIRYKRL